MKISTSVEHLPLKEPFHISGKTFVSADVLVVTVESHGSTGRGEATGVFYRGETPESMVAQVEQAGATQSGLRRADLASLLPPGGARNALDCALWELEAVQTGRPVRKLAHLDPVRPLVTTYTLGAGEPRSMAESARQYTAARALKLKLIGDDADRERIELIRAARPDVWLCVDANQSLTPQSLQALMPTLLSATVKLIEQPFPVGCEEDLASLRSPIPIAADESVQDRSDLERARGRFEVINIKLDKCGGLTEGLAMAADAKRMGFKLMVGNTLGSSLAMAPAFLLGQMCDFVDLDGPLFLARDREPSVSYADGYIYCSDDVWGSAQI